MLIWRVTEYDASSFLCATTEGGIHYVADLLHKAYPACMFTKLEYLGPVQGVLEKQESPDSSEAETRKRAQVLDDWQGRCVVDDHAWLKYVVDAPPPESLEPRAEYVSEPRDGVGTFAQQYIHDLWEAETCDRAQEVLDAWRGRCVADDHAWLKAQYTRCIRRLVSETLLRNESLEDLEAYLADDGQLALRRCLECNKVEAHGTICRQCWNRLNPTRKP